MAMIHIFFSVPVILEECQYHKYVAPHILQMIQIFFSVPVILEECQYHKYVAPHILQLYVN